MNQTLFSIPHEWFDGRLLIVWLIAGAGILAYLFFRHGWSAETRSFIPVFAIVAVAIYFVLPQLEIYNVNDEDPTGPYVKSGLAIRGYGVFLLLAIIAGIGVVILRCKQVNIHPDQVLSLAFWMVICGILGARIFYIVQKSDEFFTGQASFQETLVSVLDMTKGGLVVYGSLFGGVLAAVVFFSRHKLPVLRMADLIAPGMMIGLAIGRIGCLMNGCCYGGVCDSDLPAIRFPAGSPPYMQQLNFGDLIGLETRALTDSTAEYEREVVSVREGGIAEDLGLTVGDKVTIMAPDSLRVRYFKDPKKTIDSGQALVLYLNSEKLGQLPIPLEKVPARSRRVHPTQIYSTINASLLFLVLWLFWPLRKFDGQVFALMLILYSIGRFLLEIVRRDEAGLFGSSLTISQWVSIIAIIFGMGLWGWVTVSGRPSGPASSSILATDSAR